MTTTVNMNNAAANNEAAKAANRIFGSNKVKGALTKLAEFSSDCFKTVVEDIHDMSEMTDDEVKAEVTLSFQNAREIIKEELEFMNSIPSYSKTKDAKDTAEAMKIFLSLEGEILKNEDINIVRKVLLMFWTGCKAIAGMIVKSCMKAAKFVATFSIRVVAIGMDFIIRVIKKTVKFFKEVTTVVKAIKVAHDTKKEQEVTFEEGLDGEGI